MAKKQKPPLIPAGSTSPKIDVRLLGAYLLLIALVLYALGPIVQQSAIGPPETAPLPPPSYYYLTPFAIGIYTSIILILIFRPPFINDNQWNVLKSLHNHPQGLTSWEIKKATGMHERSVQRALIRLRRPYLKVIGTTKKRGNIYTLSEWGKGYIEGQGGKSPHPDPAAKQPANK